MKRLDDLRKTLEDIREILSEHIPADELEKSAYGPKGGGQYSPEANIRRKQTRTSEVREGVGPNVGVRQYTSAPMGSARQQAGAEARRYQQKSKKMPVKVFTPEEKRKLAESMKLKGSGESLTKDSADPKLAPKETKIKQLQQQIESGQYRPDPSKVAERVIESGDIKPAAPRQRGGGGSGGRRVEALSMSKSGQWSLKEESEELDKYSPTMTIATR